MPEKKLKSPARQMAMARRARNAQGRVMSKPQDEYLQKEEIPTPKPVYCDICGQILPCLEDSEKARLMGHNVQDTITGSIYVIAKVGHLTGTSDVYALPKGSDRYIVSSRLR